MSKKSIMPEMSVKSTKEQILTSYNEVLAKLNDKQLATPLKNRKNSKKNKS